MIADVGIVSATDVSLALEIFNQSRPTVKHR